MYQVYFIQACNTEGLIKIGHTKNVTKRLSELQTGSGSKLRLLHAIDCTSKLAAQTVERSLHEIFAYGKRKGEWFTQSSPLRTIIGKLKEGMGYTEAKSLAEKITQKKWEEQRRGLRAHLHETGQTTPELLSKINNIGKFE